jgi:hypothetical protein
MTDSVNNPVNCGDLRASKGAYLFVPTGAKRYLRVELAHPPPRDFLSQSVEIVLSQAVKSYIETDRFEVAIKPEHGIPEQVCGTITGRNEGLWVLEAEGVQFLLDLPQAPKSDSARVVCEMHGPLQGKHVKYL